MYKSNRAEVDKALKAMEQRVLTAVGAFVKTEADVRTPVDTGRLRGGNNYEVEEKRVIIYNNVEYAPHVELGTSRQRPQPYLRPAVFENIDRIKKLAEVSSKW